MNKQSETIKVRVLHPFIDKTKNCRRRTGDIFECSKGRLEEINKKAKLAEQVPTSAGTSADAAVNDIQAMFEQMNEAELRKYADETHKLTFGENVKRAEMIAALIAREKGE